MYTISVMQQNASMDEKRQHTLQNSELSFSTFKYNAVAVVRLLKKAKGEKYWEARIVLNLFPIISKSIRGKASVLYSS